jgi:hypothetical protein
MVDKEHKRKGNQNSNMCCIFLHMIIFKRQAWMSLLQKQFIVTVVNMFLVSASPSDTNHAVQKIGHF